MKIRMLVTCSGIAGAFIKDKEYTVDAAVGKDLCNAKYAEPVAKPAVKKREKRAK